MCQLCSWNCQSMLKNVLNWYWVDFCSARKRSIRLDRLIHDSSDELAVLGQSLNSVGCSLSLDSLTRWNMTSRAQSTASHPLSSHWHMTKRITTPIFRQSIFRQSSHFACTLILCPHCALCPIYSLLCSKLCPPNRRSPNPDNPGSNNYRLTGLGHFLLCHTWNYSTLQTHTLLQYCASKEH